MPRFIKNGPFVPDKLVQEMEEDRVVIFCGAGVSAGAGLPDFRGLVEYCYDELGVALPVKGSVEWNWLDRMLGGLESQFPGRMREKVVERLNMVATDLALHDALLRLASLRNSPGIRLVTTNFDLFFEQAKDDMALEVDYHSGPILPIPRNDNVSSWRSIVYLHGRIDVAGHRNQDLVLTSADFGRAYLTDAWASRFVARLFAEFTVLFIGYSLNDPVLRYMTDAFAAEDTLARNDRRRGPAYIFVPYRGALPAAETWRLRRLEPIFYRAAYGHRALRNTIIEWAKAREDYLASVKTVVVSLGPKLPSALSPSDADNLVWAVLQRPNDRGYGAKIFASLKPAAPIEWLSEFQHRDEGARKAYKEDVALARKEGREAPIEPGYHIDGLFPVRADENGATPLSDPAVQLIAWLCEHLENQDFVRWTTEKLRQNRVVHPQLRYVIRRRLNQEPELPVGYELFWRIVTSEGDWARALTPDIVLLGVEGALGATLNARWFEQELASAFRAYLRLSPSYRASAGRDVDPLVFSSIADAEVVLCHDDIVGLINRIDATTNGDAYWATKLDLLTRSLRRVFDLYAIAGEASEVLDPSVLQRPSIPPHVQNNYHDNWANIFDLLWRGWSVVDVNNGKESRHWIECWKQIPYLGFRRLVIAAVTESNHYSSEEKLEALLND